MSAPTGQVRAGRSRRPLIAVTGAATGLGHAFAVRLAAAPDLARVLALDRVRPVVPGSRSREIDVRDPGLADPLTGADAVVHLALDLGSGGDRDALHSLNVRGTATVLTAAAAAGVRRVVLVTSAMVYGARADNPVPLPEDAPLRAEPESSVLGDLLEMERLAQQAARVHPGLRVTVLRPATLVGPEADGPLTRYLHAPRLLAIKGARPRWQFCHVEDLMSALEYAALGRVSGIVTVGSTGWIEQEDVELITGTHRLELPSTVAFGTAERLHRLGITAAPASELQFIVHPCVIDSARLRAAGWQPIHSNEAALRAHVALAGPGGSRIAGRVDAAAAAKAASAAAAVVGAAALVRAARRRRRP